MREVPGQKDRSSMKFIEVSSMVMKIIPETVEMFISGRIVECIMEYSYH